MVIVTLAPATTRPPLFTLTRGELWIARDTASDLVDAIRRSTQMDVGTLTAREIDIVNRLRRIFAVLQVSNRVELALYAVEQRLTTRD